MPVELALLLAAVLGAAGLLAGVGLARRRPRSAEAVSRPPRPPDHGEQLATADHMGIGLVAIGERGLVVAANATAETLLGARRGTLVGKTTMEAFIDHSAEDLVAAARLEKHSSAEIIISGEPQRTLQVDSWAGAGRVTWVALREVSELHRLRRIRTEFLDNLSHELRTPLTTVRLLTESLSLEAERTELPPRVRQSIEKIDVETSHLAQMVTELLDLSRIEQGEAELRLEEIDLGTVVEHAVDRLRLYADRQGVTLQSETPPEPAERTVSADAERIGQLLVNYIHNAIKFSPAGGEVVVRVGPDTDEVVVAVQDHGPGISRNDLPRVFERFYKADRARARGQGGTGLGLSIARHIAERHGGRVWVESREGEGSTFFVSLPRTGPPG